MENKNALPSTSNIDKSISNAYMQRNNTSLRNNDVPKAGFSLAIKLGGGFLKKLTPVFLTLENIYASYQASKGMSGDKINKLNTLLFEVTSVSMEECGSALAVFERLNIEALNQNGVQKFNAVKKFKKAEDYVISREKLEKKRDNVNTWVERNRQLLIELEKKPADSVVVQEGVLASFFGSRRPLMRTDISLMLTQCIHGGNKDVRTPSTAVVSGI